MTERNKKLISLFLRLAFSLGLVLWLLTRIELKGIVSALKHLDLRVWLLAFVLYILAQIISSVRWWMLARSLNFPGKLVTYIGYYFVGMFFNLFLPTSVGGDVLKVFFLSKDVRRRLAATYSVIADRLFGLFALLVIGFLAVIIHPNMLPKFLVNILLFGGILSISVLLFAPVFTKLIIKCFPRFTDKLSMLVIYWKNWKNLFLIVLLSVLLQLLGMIAVILLSRSIGIDINWYYYLAIMPLIVILTLLPISFNGIGIREGGFIYFLGLKHIPSDMAFTLSLLFFSVQIVASLIGGIAYAYGFHKVSILDFNR